MLLLLLVLCTVDAVAAGESPYTLKIIANFQMDLELKSQTNGVAGWLVSAIGLTQWSCETQKFVLSYYLIILFNL